MTSERPEPDGERSATAESGDSDLRDALGMAAQVPRLALAEGRVIDDAYRIERKLGAGGMGVVYLARDLRLGRDIAIKVHTATRGGADLIREASALAKLVHPNVVTVYQIGTVDEHPYVAMEYVPGWTARSWTAGAPRTWREIVAHYLAAGRGLAAAHAAGLVHRDVKPDNILISDDGRVRVADFGLARAVDDGVDELVRGTPAYMAPEQRAGLEVGPAADQFAFAVALWEALEGQRPVRPALLAQLARDAALHADAPTPSRTPARTPAPTLTAKRMPRRIARALTRALAPAPSARWPSMDALLAAVQRGARSRAASAIRIGLEALVVIAAVAGIWLAVRGGSSPPPCAAAKSGLDEIWSPAHEEALRSALHDDDTFARVDARLGGYAERWTAQRIDACEATHVRHEQSPGLLDLREACLDRRRVELAAAIDVIEHGDALHAVDTAAALGDLDECADTARLAGAPPPDRSPAHALVEAMLAQVTALHGAGRYPTGLALARAASTRADALAPSSIIGEARYWRALLENASGDPHAARASFDDAIAAASAAKDDVEIATIWIAVIDLVASQLGQLDEAERLRPYAEAAVSRAGGGAALEASLAGAIGELRARQGRYDDAKTQLAHAVELVSAARGDDDPRLARDLVRLGDVLRVAGDLDGARATLERAHELIARIYGPEHPDVARTLGDLAAVDLDAGRYDLARSLLEQAIAIKQRALGADHPDLIPSYGNLGMALLKLDDAKAADAAFLRGVTIAEARLGPDDATLARALTFRSEAQLALGDLAGARASLERAAAIEDHTDTHGVAAIETAMDLAILQSREGDAAAARATLARAQGLVTSLNGQDTRQATEIALMLGELSHGRTL